MGPLQVYMSAHSSSVLRGRDLQENQLAGIPGLFKLVDDILVQGRTKKELIDRGRLQSLPREPDYTQ